MAWKGLVRSRRAFECQVGRGMDDWVALRSGRAFGELTCC